MIQLILVLPVLLMLGLGSAEYAYFIYAKNVMQDAARNGALLAIQSTATDASVKAEIDTTMAAAGYATSGYTVTTTPSSIATIATGTATTVTVSCSWSGFNAHVLPVYLGGINPARTVVATVTMVRE